MNCNIIVGNNTMSALLKDDITLNCSEASQPLKLSNEEFHRYDNVLCITNQDLTKMSVEDVNQVKGIVLLVDFQTKNILAKFVDGKMVREIPLE